MAAGLAKKIRKYLKTRNRAGRMFKEASALLAEIVPEMKIKRDKRVPISRDHNAVLVDQFAEKLTVFKVAGVDRFLIEVQDK